MELGNSIFKISPSYMYIIIINSNFELYMYLFPGKYKKKKSD